MKEKFISSATAIDQFQGINIGSVREGFEFSQPTLMVAKAFMSN